jgi:predicted HTH domain antitoxin
MSITLTIPDSVAQGLRLPAGEAEARLCTELALVLYSQGILSFGKAAELAHTTRLLLADLAAQRGIARHYDGDDLASDLSYARSQ